MFQYPRKFDVIVVGAGHAGVEAALAAARMGCQTLLLTINADTIGQMSCNPAIGGLAKGHLAREIDALGGEMGKATDMTGLQFRMLNTKRGPSVWAPRAQCDKKAYQFRLKWICEREPNLDIKQGQVLRILHSDGAACGIETTLEVQYLGQTVVITTGTFLRGLMHIGTNQQSGGRAGESAAMGLSGSLKELGLELGRLKTGTPPRLLRRTIDFSKTEVQPGDEPIPYFTYWKDDLFHVEQEQPQIQSSNPQTSAKFHVEQNSQKPNENSQAETSQAETSQAENFKAETAGNEELQTSNVKPQTLADSGKPQTSSDLGKLLTLNFQLQTSSTPLPPSPPPLLYPPGSILAQLNGQLPCYITYTTDATAEIIRANLHKSPMYSGVIEGVGPRYCPSIEDKIVKFPEKERQQIFLEPEGIATDEIYVNGFSTCLPFEVQVGLVRTIVGCENAEILRPAYAVEYDFAYPTQLHPSLETKACRNLYLAGQINGTSGYEEAGAQGLIAGINAARRVQGKEPVILRRNEAYIGVLIDDLVTKGTIEPYRMFTSRAEHRLLLRQDNADLRLSQLGFDIGLLPVRNFRKFDAKRSAIESELARLEQTRVGSDLLSQLLRRPEITYDKLPSRDDTLPAEVTQQVEIAIKYQGYIDRQEIEVAKLKTLDDKQIPSWMDYCKVPSLRTEARQKLLKIQPATIGQASRISGVSPSDISILLVWMKNAPSAEEAVES